MTVGPVEQYFVNLRDIRSSGEAVKETSYYGALEGLLNSIGSGLKPKVRCVVNIKNRGAGIPDGGLFTSDQFQTFSDAEPPIGTSPARGVIEVKGTDEQVVSISDTRQVSKYWKKYGQVLVTNYRDFLLVGKDESGNPVKLESYRLAEDEDAFWNAVSHTRSLARVHEGPLSEYLRRILLHGAPLTSPEDVAWYLASYAKEARSRIESADLPALGMVRSALEESLGIKFEGVKGEHFFRSTLIQTLFYGVFSAWVLWSKQRTPDGPAFDWRLASWSLRVPMIKALFEQVGTKTKLGPLGLVELLDWTSAALNRIDVTAFFSRFEEGHAVQYFYEPFLEAFDPELRKELGVWYTPPEIVRYMVERIDAVLRSELEIPDGLADPRVFVLDPCCGTGAYLVEVLRRIATTLRDRGEDALVADDIREAVSNRVFGFEILPAPFVVAHLQIGLMLQQLGCPLSETDRAGVYLTNALTGWELPKGPKSRVLFPELEEEREAANRVKRERPILVILGNPPYNAFAGISPAEEQGLVDRYKDRLAADWGIKKFNMDELYVRFFSLAEKRIADVTQEGIVCFISNHSWLRDPSFVLLRKSLASSFDQFWIENMHGDRRRTEYAPDGRTSETIFAIPGFSVGIQQGVAISLWVKHRVPRPLSVRFRDDLDSARAVDRRAQLLATLDDQEAESAYVAARPTPDNWYSFRPSTVSGSYLLWPSVMDLCAEDPSNGLMEKRAGALIDSSKELLEQRMRAFYDKTVPWEKLTGVPRGLMEDAARFDARKTRAKVLAAESYTGWNLRRYALRPFDTRWCYYSAVRPLWNEPRPSLWGEAWAGNSFLLTRFKRAKDPEGTPFSFTECLCDDHFLSPDCVAIPVRLRVRPGKSKTVGVADTLFDGADHVRHVANLSPAARAYLKAMSVSNVDDDHGEASLIWLSALAIGYSSAYVDENADGTESNWPRVPLPSTEAQLRASAGLGRTVAALIDQDKAVPGVTVGAIRAELGTIAVLSKDGGGAIDPGGDDLAVTAGWGHFGKEGVVSPGKGRVVERPYTRLERTALAAGASALGLSEAEALSLLGEATSDVYLNERVYWRNVPPRVWEYYIGGYQVLKKWLSYRDRSVIGRTLGKEEAREVSATCRRLAALLLLDPALVANYRQIVASPSTTIVRRVGARR